MPAYRSQAGIVSLREPLDTEAPRDYLRLPCGRCLGCHKAKAREWVVRCTLELRDHTHASFVTLTYNDKHLPPTLTRDHLSLYVRYLRRKLPIRFFGCGEYGEQNGRPHYHAIIFGAHSDEKALKTAWGKQGFVTAEPVTPRRIAYTAGYTAKKLQDRMERLRPTEQVSPDGEPYFYQPPFHQMSLKPGIAAHARDKYWSSWRKTAIDSGREIPVPRYLHQGWIKKTSPEQHLTLEQEIKNTPKPLLTREHLRASAEIALSRHNLHAQTRRL